MTTETKMKLFDAARDSEAKMRAIKRAARNGQLDAQFTLKLGPYTLECMEAWDAHCMCAEHVVAHYKIVELSKGNITTLLTVYPEEERAEFKAQIKLPAPWTFNNLPLLVETLRGKDHISDNYFNVGSVKAKIGYEIRTDYRPEPTTGEKMPHATAVALNLEATLWFKDESEWVSNNNILKDIGDLTAFTKLLREQLYRNNSGAARPPTVTDDHASVVQALCKNAAELAKAEDLETRKRLRKAATSKYDNEAKAAKQLLQMYYCE